MGKRKDLSILQTINDVSLHDLARLRFSNGMTINERYEVMEMLGVGGMGVVYKVKDCKLGDDIKAMKVMLDKLTLEKKARERFRNEVLISQKLNHPNILRVYDYGEVDALMFLTMEYVAGPNMREWLEERQEKGAIPLREMVELVVEILDGLEAAHRSTVHRDIKPENVLLPKGEEVRVKICDFGLAQLQSRGVKLSSSQVLGTYDYMAPEQRIAAGCADRRADLYSLGVLCYECLTGRFPIGRFKLPTQMREDLPEAIDQFIEKALEPEAKDRFQEAREMKEALLGIVGKVGVSGEKKGKVEKGQALEKMKQKLGKGKGLRVAMVVVVLLVVGGMVVGGLVNSDAWDRAAIARERQQREAELSHEREKREAERQAKEQAQWAPAGFTYVRTATYSCGGRSYTVKEYRHEKTGMEFVLIPGGSFQMGSTDGKSDEKPVHEVEISSFLLGKTEVTQGVWQRIMRTTPWKLQIYVQEGENNPKVYVSWYDAQKFCQETGLCLPTEAQWEYACRGGTTSKYYWGDKINGNYCWYNKNAVDIGEKYAHRVGGKKANAYGLYDMSGNVWEWCADWYDSEYYSKSPRQNPVNTTPGSIRVFRGGSWFNDAHYCRSAYRVSFCVSNGFNFGFRAASPVP